MNTFPLPKLFVFWLIIVLMPSLASGKTRVYGHVTYNGISPVANANVALDGTYDGATANQKGEFSFETEESGTFTLLVKADGYVTIQQAIEIPASGSVKVALAFTTKSFSLEAITVRPKLFDLTDKNKYTVLKPIDVLTTATDGNITSALKTMPGAQAIGESGDLFVRGGTGTETKVFIDGMLVNNYTYSAPNNLAARSRFAPGMFKGTFFATGAYSAQYGQALSSTLMLETEDLPVKSSADLTISPIMIGGGWVKLSRDKKTTISGSVNHTNLILYNAVAPGAVRFPKAPRFLDGGFFVRHQLNNGGMLKFYASTGQSNVGVDRSNLDFEGLTNRIGLKNQNVYTNLSYRQTLKGGWKWQAGASFSRNLDRTHVQPVLTESNQPLDTTIALTDATSLWQMRHVFSKLILNRTRLFVGAEWQRTTETHNQASVTDNYVAQFVEAESYVTDDLSVRAGVRVEYSALLNRANVAPRVSVGYNVGNNGLFSASYGRFFQKPDRQFLLQTANLTYAEADHYVLSYQQIANDRTVRVEAFHKQYNNLITTLPTVQNGGWGYARGVEVFFRDKKSIKGVDYWASYSFLDTKRQFLTYTAYVQPSFAAKHTASLVIKRYFAAQRTNIGLTYTYASGRPFANPNRPESQFMADRTIDYHNLGVSVAYLPKIGKTMSVIVLTVSNVLGNQQVYGYTYSTTNLQRREAITPTNNPFVFLGLIMNIGTDRRQDVINSQL